MPNDLDFNIYSASISLEARRILQDLIVTPTFINEDCMNLIHKTLLQVRDNSPASFVQHMATMLGAPPEHALKVAVFTEIYFAMCNFMDDIQDGDTKQYFEHVDQSILINTIGQLICLNTYMPSILLDFCDDSHRADLVKTISKNGIGMLTGQYIEINRLHWNQDTYIKVCKYIGGMQYQIYFHVACLPSNFNPYIFSDYAKCYGALLNFKIDFQTNDERLMSFSSSVVDTIYQQLKKDLETTQSALPKNDIIKPLFKKLTCDILVNEMEETKDQ